VGFLKKVKLTGFFFFRLRIKDNRFKISGGLEEVTWASLSFLSSANYSDSCACVSAPSNATDQTTPLCQMQKTPYPQSHFQKTLCT